MSKDHPAINAALGQALKIVRHNVEHYYDRFQHVSENDVYPKEENKVWTMGFYPGELYLAYLNTKDEYYLSKREQILASFKSRCESGHMETHDIGFLYEMTAYYDYKATGDEQSKALFLAAADKLMARYNEKGGFIQAWGPMDPHADKTRIIIDCMMNLPHLYLASELTGDSKYREAAISHAKVSSKTLIRDDFSSYHTYWMDVQSGKPLHGATHQGHKDESTWARGQAWAVYGFYKSYVFTQDPSFLEIATKCADVYLANLPENDINYWDFDFTDETPDIRDSSATAIFVAGLVRLARVLEGEKATTYQKASGDLLTILAQRYQNTDVYEGAGILREGMYHRDLGTAFVSWGDYYYLEALYAFLGLPSSSEEM
ncbi:glycoside hydrolase family 88 protein [Pelagicoccus enzymogenes]|uniref:glycoside hydrolase family 88 protein n=1 Tax=Pelagicoccus enzymogenes TaxID=2773457 RepID=UPI00280FF23C|nr:glycoside hydrolase family 88 protein [Pelagicoccus enzymogenes]MDQ8198624.1 glycoside hydrolase family 88 protein [Pelagicoccus enzymogenes]